MPREAKREQYSDIEELPYIKMQKEEERRYGL